MTTTTLNDYGALLLGSRLRRLADQLYAGVDVCYRAAGVELSSRCFPILFLLRDNGATSITVLATQIGQSHPAVVQLSRKLLEAGVVTETTSPTDERRRLLALSETGRTLMQHMAPLWEDIRAAVDSVTDNSTDALLGTLARLEASLQATGFADVIAARKRARESAAVDIIDYHADYAADFKRLNIEWLERYFYVEAIDNEVLSNPHSSILAGGGHIFMARLDGRIIGTCALIRASDTSFELSKMAVTTDSQGLGLGRRLIERALAAFRASGVPLLYLESNSKLAPAIKLYETSGFVHAPRPDGDSHYQRADVYMEWRG